MFTVDFVTPLLLFKVYFNDAIVVGYSVLVAQALFQRSGWWERCSVIHNVTRSFNDVYECEATDVYSVLL